MITYQTGENTRKKTATHKFRKSDEVIPVLPGPKKRREKGEDHRFYERAFLGHSDYTSEEDKETDTDGQQNRIPHCLLFLTELNRGKVEGESVTLKL
jgi:hypothetical protein